MNSSPQNSENGKKQQPLVSIIVITYNSARFVLETLESARAQTYKNIELIVSDDASTDDTVEICRNWINEKNERFVRTELITVPDNTGIPANCNRGLRAAKGEWIKYIAGDDALMEDCIMDNLDHINRNFGISILTSRSKCYENTFDERNLVSTYPSESVILSFFSKHIEPIDQFEYLLSKNVINACTVFLRKKIIVEVGCFDETLRFIEDYPMWLKLTKAGYRIHYFNRITALYRLTNESLSANKKEGLFNNSLHTYERVRKKYVYPELPLQKVLSFKYTYYVSVCLKSMLFNKRNKFSYYVARFFLRKINPF